MKVDDVSVARTDAKETAEIFDDTTDQIHKIPKRLVGSHLFQLSWKNGSKISLSFTASTDSTILLAIWEDDSNSLKRDPGLEISLMYDGWSLRNEFDNELWRKSRIHFDGSHFVVHGKTLSILSKKIHSGQEISFNKPKNKLPISIFVVQGLLKLYL